MRKKLTVCNKTSWVYVKAEMPIKTFLISESELHQIENGNKSVNYSNWCIFFASVFVSIVLTLISSEFNQILFACLVSGGAVSLTIFAFLLINIYKSKKETSKVLNSVKRRICKLILNNENG